MSSQALKKTSVAATLEPKTEKQKSEGPLWLCLWFPYLALNALNIKDEQPFVVIEKMDTRPLVHVASETAQAFGIESGMPFNTANVLCPHILYAVRDTKQETKLLHVLAQQLLEFSSWVSPEYPQALLVEIRSSLKLFENIQNLLELIGDKLGHHYHWSIAPTPKAALLAAQSKLSIQITRKSDIRSILGEVVIDVLPFDQKFLRRIKNVGLRTLRDLWRLPRDGMTRRFGQALTIYLDQLTGLRPDHRDHYLSPPTFAHSDDLLFETDNAEYYLPLVGMLIEKLCAYLLKQDAVTSSLTLKLQHPRGASTRIDLTFRQRTREAEHIFALLRERIERTTLPNTVIGAGMESRDIFPYLAEDRDLFGLSNDGSRNETWAKLEEELAVRLGDQALQSLSAPADHRPEKAITTVKARHIGARNPRPLWLLPKPVPYTRNCNDFKNPERIESGWWDAEPIRRDYFVVQNDQQQKLWIFKDLNNKAWYLHGFFA